MRKLYPVVGLGGTFDHFHRGHEKFISFASQFGQHLHLGITHSSLTRNKPYSELIKSFQDRQWAVKKFCQHHQISAASTQLTDIYGPTLNPETKIKALIATPDTQAGTEKINQARVALGLRKLPVHVCPLVKDETGGGIISSERIRAGEINRQGKIYEQIFQKNMTLTPQQKEFFSQPQGEIIKKPQINLTTTTLLVGDSTLEKFITNDWPYDLGIYDLKTQRQVVSLKILKDLKPEYAVKNPAGVITTELVSILKKSLNQSEKNRSKKISSPQHLFISGEEDLAAVALVLLSPLKTRIYYGQPNQGIVEMVVTEKLKEVFYEQLTK